MTRRLSHADARPRIHLLQSREGWRWGTHPAAVNSPPYATAGRALDAAASYLSQDQAVVIMGPSL